MFSLRKKLKFITINQDYLKYLHDCCPEVYYKPTGYERKPYIGILVQENDIEYVIPLSSAKDKHRTWKNVDVDRFLIFENCEEAERGSKGIYVENADGTFKHILSVMDLKKMIPIRAGLYSEVDLNPAEDDSAAEKKYKVLLHIEYSFCLKIIDSVINKASRLYEKQIRTKKVIKFCCDFRLLEEKCKTYNV
ncbi:MAG: type III toxin-antitoxin system ToxN/AbiQ family toxin [Treponemataceae bacterium]|nr:type III toxin-antitoxin system ToxN/AbiQ family toxin [Treponemataceae bacterium]